MENNKIDGLSQQIELAKKAFNEWPAWMKSVAYVSSTALSTDSAKKVFEESLQGAVNHGHKTGK